MLSKMGLFLLRPAVKFRLILRFIITILWKYSHLS